MADVILALDQGTSSSRAFLVDREARLFALRQIPLQSRFPQSGWVEHDALEIWHSLRDAARALLRDALPPDDRVVAIGIANQRETAVVWDRVTLEPIGPAIGWQCRRTAQACATLERSHGDTIRRKTGLVADAYFSGPKIAWLLDAVPGARRRAEAGDLAAGTVDTWLLARLTNGAAHRSDRTNASRTLCYDIHRDAWDAELCRAQGVPLALLPQVVPSISEFGVAAAEHLGCSAPVLAVAGDQQAALFGQACLQPGPVKVTYGTGAFLLTHTGPRALGPVPGLLTTVAASSAEPAYALEGSVFSAGSLVQWLRDELHLIDDSAAIESLAAATPDSGGVAIIPAFSGLGAPHWQPDVRAMIAGLSRATGAAQIARAALEAIAFRVRDVVEALDAARGEPIAELRVDGAAAANDLLLQIQANAIGRPVLRPAQLETTALGVALMAGVGAGFWNTTHTPASRRQVTQAPVQRWRAETRFDPTHDLTPTYNRWQQVRDAAIRLAHDEPGAAGNTPAATTEDGT